MVAVVSSIIGGVFVALASDELAPGELPVIAAATVGFLVAVATITGFAWHQVLRWRAAEDRVPSLFPSDAVPGADSATGP